MLGFGLLIIITVALCILINRWKPSEGRFNFYSMLMTPFLAPTIWHIVGYMVDGPKVIMWLTISFPISMVVSLLTAGATNLLWSMAIKAKDDR